MGNFNPNGAIIYEGPSMLDGSPIIVIATGLKQSSQNEKTGGLIQTWILRADMLPTDAVKSGADDAICGSCIHRGVWSEELQSWIERSCYVNVGQAPQNVYRTAMRGRYERRAPHGMGRGRKVRVGSYGDPGAVPLWVWLALLEGCAKVQTGYTHQWRRFPELAQFCMASVDTLAEAAEAKILGFRTFRVTDSLESKLADEAGCPASEEMGKRTTCDRCGLCAGAKVQAKSIVIVAHGSGRNHAKRRAAS